MLTMPAQYDKRCYDAVLTNITHHRLNVIGDTFCNNDEYVLASFSSILADYVLVQGSAVYLFLITRRSDGKKEEKKLYF